jgi:hypothetical protein
VVISVHETFEPDRQRSRMGCLKYVGWGALILAIVVAIGIFGNRVQNANQLQKMLAEMDSTEPGWRMEEIEAARETVPEEENSARIVVAAAERLPKQWPSKDFHEEDSHFGPPNEKMSEADFLLLSRELASVKSALETAIKLADMPRGRHRIVWESNPIATLLPDQQESRRIMKLLCYEAVRLSQKGETKEALTACRAALNAARSLGDEPIYISQLIRIAGATRACKAIERTVAQGEPPVEDMRVLQKLLENEDALSLLLAATRGERASLHRVFEGVERGEISLRELEGTTGTSSNWLEGSVIDLWRMDTDEDHALALSLMTRRIKEIQRPMPEQAALEKQFEQDVRNMPRTAYITYLLLPALSKISEAFRRKHAILRCTIVALAAERYRQDKKIWPDKLDQLCPHYLTAVPVDPHDGAPLRYRRLKDGVVIYSVGGDGVDNGGNLSDNPTKVGADMGFSLWDAAKRRQPPRTKPPDVVRPGGRR